MTKNTGWNWTNPISQELNLPAYQAWHHLTTWLRIHHINPGYTEYHEHGNELHIKPHGDLRQLLENTTSNKWNHRRSKLNHHLHQHGYYWQQGTNNDWHLKTY